GYGTPQGENPSGGFGLPQRGQAQPGGFENGFGQRGEAPSGGFGAPAENPSGGFGAPQNDGGFGAPQNDGGFGAPPFGAPPQGDNNGYGAPQGDNGYGAPQSDNVYGAPQGDNVYGAPQGENPSGGFGLPQRNVDGEPQSGGFPAAPEAPGFGGFPPPGDGNNPGVAPQSPARATARASASARVTPPEAPGNGSPFAMPGSPQFPVPGSNAVPGSPQFPGSAPPFGGPGDQGGSPFGAPADAPFGAPADSPFGSPAGPPFDAGRGVPADQYNEHTTDVSGRGDSSFVPAPALSPMPGEQPGSGLYPGSPAARATVTPPGPEDTTSWPGPADEQSKFDQFKTETPAPAPAKSNVRTIPVALAVVLGATILLAMVFGLVYLISGKDEFKVATGDCVKREGTTPVVAACTEADTYTVTSVAASEKECESASQPYILVPKDSGNQVLCLKKNG
ncbi:MAG TPA: hypothetical protein VN408_42495, partial [Actinoplanes sp.]|nr:hypothetical protein [Actinoplanes sp.]